MSLLVDHARAVTRERDRQLIALLTTALDPFRPAITVYRADDTPLLELRVRFAGLAVRLPVDEAQLYRHGLEQTVARLAADLRAAWHAYPAAEIPPNITPGTE